MITFILSTGAVRVLETAPEIPPEMSVTIGEFCWSYNGSSFVL